MEDTGQHYVAGVQSRKRIIQPGADRDNFGFAGWVMERELEIAEKLGEGYHYGEWYGVGIQKNPHRLDNRSFALFNSNRWRDGRQERPDGVDCVPVLFEGEWTPTIIDETMEQLVDRAISAQYKAEGIVVWYSKTRRFEKYTFNNELGKWVGT
jgi:hypothetical protein